MWSHKHEKLTYYSYVVTQARKVNTYLLMYVVTQARKVNLHMLCGHTSTKS